MTSSGSVARHRIRGSWATAGLVLLGCLGSACESDGPPPDPDAELPPRPSPASAPAPVEPEAGPGPQGPAPGTEADSASSGPLTVFDRQLVFLSTGPGGEAPEADSVVIVPWAFRARSNLERVQHTQSVWFARAGEWETLGEEALDAPPSRTPWRILPGDHVRIVVGTGDRIESLIYRNPPRELETEIGDLLGEHERPDGVSVALYEATTSFPSGSVSGVLIDLRRRWTEPAPDEPGDWLFAYGGTDLQLFMRELPPPADTLPGSDAPGGSDAAGASRYRGWVRLAFRDLPQEEIRVRWAETRPFERARRDIPVSWSFASPDSSVTGRLESVSTHLTAGEGEGPILPVHGFFTVSGNVRVQGEEFEVVGLVRHTRRR